MAESLPIVKSLPEQLSVPLWAKNLDSKEKHRRLERVRDRLDPVGQLSEVERIISAWSCAAVGVDSTYPRPDFMKPGHELWEDFRRQMLGLMDATSFETVAAVLDHWNDRFEEDDVLENAAHQQLKDIRAGLPGVTSSIASYQFVEFAAVKAAVDRLLDKFGAYAVKEDGILGSEVKACGFPLKMLWQPPETWSVTHDTEYKHLKNMVIPTVPNTKTKNSHPDMLLYELGRFSKVDRDIVEKLEDFEERDARFQLLSDTSGSGKTKFMIEYLAAYRFGFYFTFETDRSTNPYGSRDLAQALATINNPFHKLAPNEPFRPMVISRFTGENESDRLDRWNRAWTHNFQIAERVLNTLVLSRLLVCEKFLEIADMTGFGNAEDIRRAWCLLQLVPHLSGKGDIFSQVFRRVSILSASSAADECARAVSRIRKNHRIEDLAIAVDEAQAGTALYATSFGPYVHIADPNDFASNTRPALKPVIEILQLTINPAKILISGTKISRDAILEALVSTSAKPPREAPESVPLGDMFGDEKLKSFVDHFLSKGFWTRLSVRTRNEVAFWFPGRHRWMSVFVACLLRTGPSDSNIISLINALVSKLSGYSIPNVPAPDVGKDPFGLVDVHRLMPRLLEEDVSQANPDLIRELERITVNILISREYVRHSGTEDIHRLVELGIGRISRRMKGRAGMDISVNENLVLLALWNWFTRPSARNGKSRLQHHLELFKSSPRGPVAGYTWEDVTAYLVRHWFSGGGKQLDHIFRVMNGNFPFASQNFQLAQMLTVDEQGNVEAIISTQGNTLGGSTQSHTPAETLKLLLPSSVDYNLRRGYAIVKPDVNMGPDLCFVLVRSDGTRILVNIQCKDRSEQLSSEEVYTALDKLKPDGWWPPKRAATTRKTETPLDKIRNGTADPCAEDLRNLFPLPVDGSFSPLQISNSDTLPQQISTSAINTSVSATVTEQAVASGSVAQPGVDASELQSGKQPVAAVLRVIAAFDVATVTDVERIGSYPYAVFSQEALYSAAKDFDGVRRSLAHAQIREHVDYQSRRTATHHPPGERRPEVEEVLLKELQQSYRQQVKSGDAIAYHPVKTLDKWRRKKDTVRASKSRSKLVVLPSTTRARARDPDDANDTSGPIAKRARMDKAEHSGDVAQPAMSRDFATIENFE